MSKTRRNPSGAGMGLIVALFTALHVPRVRARKRVTRCYELAGRGLLSAGGNSPWDLVHGTIQGKEGLLGHAWLERDGIVYDPVADFLFAARDYRRIRRARTIRRYSAIEAIKTMAESKLYGPWIRKPGMIFREERQ